MNKASNDLANWCECMIETVKLADISKNLVERISLFRQSVEQQELLVPVVGSFSAGKSTLLNKILGEAILPAAITPETSLAMELRYSTEQRIEAVKEDGSVTRFDICEIKKIADDAAKYRHARLYLDNIRIKELEPLLLVDMPGFDSPLDAHNKAIMAYIDRGCHYIVLASVQEGTVSKSLLRRIREIRELGRDLSFFLTKADLKPQSEIDDLIEHFTESLRDNFDYTGEVIPVSHASPGAVVSLLNSINADQILFSLYRPELKGLSNDLIDAINIQISALKKDNASFVAAVEELASSLKKLQTKSEDEIDSLSRRYAGGGVVNEILSDVGRALESALPELINIAKGGDIVCTERHLLDIVRSELNISVNKRLGEVNKEIVSDLSDSLKSLDRVMRDLEVSSDFTNKLAGVIGTQLQTLSIGKGAGKVATLVAPKLIGAGTKIAGISLASIVNPLLSIALAFLPEILGWLFGGDKESKKEEKLRSAFLGQAFPQIKTKLRTELQNLVTESVREMIEQVRAQYETKISQKKDELEAAMKKNEANVTEKDQAIAGLEKVREAVKLASNELLVSYN